MCYGSWDCSCTGPEYECDKCDEKDKQIESIYYYLEGVMEHITNGDIDLLDHCLNQLCSNVGVKWPQDQNGNYKELIIRKAS